jgi:hypothetical protein
LLTAVILDGPGPSKIARCTPPSPLLTSQPANVSAGSP